MTNVYYFGYQGFGPKFYNSETYKEIQLKQNLPFVEELADKLIDFGYFKLQEQLLTGTMILDEQNQLKPNKTMQKQKKVPIFTSINCGSKSTCLQDNKGSYWFFGQGQEGYIGNCNQFFQTMLGTMFFTSIKFQKYYKEKINQHQQLPINITKLTMYKFSQLSCGEGHFIGYEDRTQKLYGWGNSQLGKLGMLNIENSINPIDITQNVIDNPIKQVLEKAEKGDQIAASFQNQISRRSNVKNTPEENNAKQIIAVFAGRQHSYVQTSNYVIGFGIDRNSMMGLGNKEEGILLPSIIPSLSQISLKGVSFGKEHCLAWDTKGAIYAWGRATEGQLGHPIQPGLNFNKVELFPKHIKALSENFIIHASCGNYHSLALTSDGEIYQWGKIELSQSSQKQLTENEQISIIDSIICKKVQIQEQKKMEVKFIKIACGYSHCAAIDQLGRLYTWGDPSENCLGHAGSQNIYQMKLVQSFLHTKIIDVGCGDRFTVVAVLAATQPKNQDKQLLLQNQSNQNKLYQQFKNNMITNAKSMIKTITDYSKAKIQLQQIQYLKSNPGSPTGKQQSSQQKIQISSVDIQPSPKEYNEINLEFNKKQFNNRLSNTIIANFQTPNLFKANQQQIKAEFDPSIQEFSSSQPNLANIKNYNSKQLIKCGTSNFNSSKSSASHKHTISTQSNQSSSNNQRRQLISCKNFTSTTLDKLQNIIMKSSRQSGFYDIQNKEPTEMDDQRLSLKSNQQNKLNYDDQNQKFSIQVSSTHQQLNKLQSMPDVKLLEVNTQKVSFVPSIAEFIDNNNQQDVSSKASFLDINYNNANQSQQSNNRQSINFLQRQNFSMQTNQPIPDQYNLAFYNLVKVLQKYNKNTYTLTQTKNLKSRNVATVQYDTIVDNILDQEKNDPLYIPLDPSKVKSMEYQNPNLLEEQKQLSNQKINQSKTNGLNLKRHSMSQQFNIHQVTLQQKANTPLTNPTQQNDKPDDDDTNKDTKNLKSLSSIKKNIKTQVDLLKYQYIDMVQHGNEQEHYQYLFSNPTKLQSLDKAIIYDLKNSNVHQQYQQNLELIQDNIEKGLKSVEGLFLFPNTQQMHSEIKSTLEKNSDLLQKCITDYEIIKQNLDLNNPSFYQTFKQKLEKIQAAADLLRQKIEQAQQIKEDKLQKKIQIMKLNQLKKDREYRSVEDKKRHILKLEMQKKAKLLKIVNIDIILNLFKQIANQGLFFRRDQFKLHMKARIIQATFRKYQIKKKIINNMENKTKMFFKKCIFKFKIKRKIKRRKIACKLIKMVMLSKIIKRQMKSRIMNLLTKIRNIQKFFNWIEKFLNWQINKIAYQFDAHLLVQFKVSDIDFLKQQKRPGDNSPLKKSPTINPQNLEKDINLNQFISFQDFCNKSNIQKQTLKNAIRMKKESQQQIFSDHLQLIPNIIPTTYDMKNATIEQLHQKKIQTQPSKSNEQSKRQSIFGDIQEILIPLTLHANKFQLPPQYKVKQESDFIHQAIYPRLVEFEINNKFKLIKQYIMNTRKQFVKKLNEYQAKLKQYVLDNIKDVNLERAQLMLRTNPDELNSIHRREEIEYKSLLRNSIYNKKDTELLQFYQDHLPFGSMILLIAARMPNSPKKPIFQLQQGLNFDDLFQKYFNEFNIQYQKLAVQERINILTKSKKKINNQKKQEKKAQAIQLSDSDSSEDQ